MKKYIYQLSTAEILFFDEPNETYNNNFIMVADVTEDEMLYGEIVRHPILKITLETQKYRIYQATDLEYNRVKCNKEINQKRKYFLKNYLSTFVFRDVKFDGNDSQDTVSSKENIIGLYNALESLSLEFKNAMFPLAWVSFDNNSFELSTYQDFLEFFQTFTVFRLSFEKQVNENCFLAKYLISQSGNVSDMQKAVSDYDSNITALN